MVTKHTIKTCPEHIVRGITSFWILKSFPISSHCLSPYLIASLPMEPIHLVHTKVWASAITLKSEDRRKEVFGWQELSRRY